MPRNFKTQKATPNATLPLVGPGFRGLNTELSAGAGFMDGTWASQLNNAVFDDLGRITLRKGIVDQTLTQNAGASVTMHHMHEYLRADGTVTLFAIASSFAIFKSDDGGDSWVNVSGDTAGLLINHDMQFTNFNGELFLGARGHQIYQYTDTLGSFTTLPNSPVCNGSIMGAFGRLWCGVDASGIISYSGLLNAEDWLSTSSGSIDATNAWTDGQDEVMAIASFGASFLVFGKNHILVYVDGAGSVLGIDPDNMYVVDTVEGTGTHDRDSILNIGEGDLWFLGPQGVQSMARVIEDKVNPLTDISQQQRSLAQALIDAHVGSITSVKAIYSHSERFVLIAFPESDIILGYDLRFPLQDGTYRAFTWQLSDSHGMLVRRNGDILFGLNQGNVALYDTYRDLGVAYALEFATPWLNFGQDAHTNLKILKGAHVVLYGKGNLSGDVRWGKDYRPLEYSESYTNAYNASGAEWGDGEWGSGEFGDGLRMRSERVALSGEGTVVKLYIDIEGDEDYKIALQEVVIHAKIGRRT